MSGGAVIVMRQNRYMRRFREAGATSADRAVTLDEIGCRDHWIFRRMVRRGVFVHLGEGRYFLDEAGASRFVRRRRTMMLVLLAVALALWIVYGL
ncbi:MAG: hypothetical protein GY851_17940 [bacterium]|nr:hypothetical protein [bacterium]